MFNFHSTFLNRELDPDEEVYMEQPQGYEESDKKGMCVNYSNLCMDSNRQAENGTMLFAKCSLIYIGFRQSEADPAVFYAHYNGNITILACHVDDCMITRNFQISIQDYKDKLKEKYSLTDLGPANWLLGIKITRDLET